MNLNRRFGVEIEICSFDGKKTTPKREQPKGIDYVACKLSNLLEKRVEIRSYKENHNSDVWLIKPDSSCGMEICSPISKGPYGIDEIGKVIKYLGQDDNIKINKDCSFHIHVNIEDLNKEQIGSVIAHWIKCEAVIFDSMVLSRKMNRYCQMIGISDSLQCHIVPTSSFLINLVGRYKYYSLNGFHYRNNKRKTLEVRTMESKACQDVYWATTWIHFVLHFFDVTSNLPIPSGLQWLDPLDVFKLLELEREDLREVKSWFLNCLYVNSQTAMDLGFWSRHSRAPSINEISELYEKNIYNK